jgi:hypothetical protein
MKVPTTAKGSAVMAESPVKIDLTHGFNRAVDSWYGLFQAGTKLEMPDSACAYPGGFQQADIDHVREHSQQQWHQMELDESQRLTDTIWLWRYLSNKLEWELHVSWEGLMYQHEDQVLWLIDNARAFCNLTHTANMELDVNVQFGHPTFQGGDAVLPVYFHVKCMDDDTPLKDEQVGFAIHGTGLSLRVS